MKKSSHTCQQHDLRSDGLQQSQIDQVAQKCDLRSERLHQSENTKMNYKAHVDFPRAFSRESNRNDHCRRSSVNSNDSDNGYDTKF